MWVPWFDFANHPSEAPSLRDDTEGRAGGAAPRAHGGSDHQRPPIQLDIRYDVERHALVLSTLAPAAAGEELHYLYHGSTATGSGRDCGGSNAQCCRDEDFLNTYGFGPRGLKHCQVTSDSGVR